MEVRGERFASVVRVPRDEVRPWKGQPRRYFDYSSLMELAKSIKAIGQKVPVEIRPISDGGKCEYELVDGERRWRACEIAGVNHILAIVTRTSDPKELFDDAVIANFNRAGHTVLETARAIAHMKTYRDVASIARVFGRSEAWVYQHLTILKLPPIVLNLMEPSVQEDRRLVFSIALLIVQIPGPELQIETALHISEKQLRLYQAKDYIKKILAERGLAVTRSTTPNKELIKLYGFLERTVGQLSIFVEINVQDLRRLFCFRAPRDLLNTIKLVTEIQGAFDKISRMLKTVSEATER